VDVVAVSAALLKQESLGELERSLSVAVDEQSAVDKNKDALLNRGLAVDNRVVAVEGEAR